MPSDSFEFEEKIREIHTGLNDKATINIEPGTVLNLYDAIEDCLYEKAKIDYLGADVVVWIYQGSEHWQARSEVYFSKQ